MKVSNLTVAGALSAGDLFYLVQGTNSRKLALSSLSSYILTGGFTATLGATTVTSLTSSGAIAANGGSITTSVTTFALVDTVATTVNFARAATAVTIGATTGTTTVRNNLTVSGGTVTATTFTGNAATATTLQTARTISISGDVTGSVSFNGSANVDIVATIAANSVALGTDTTGNYVATIAGTADRITVTGSGVENATVTINADATSANTANKIVARDASGNFSAGTITATAINAGPISAGTISGTTGTFSGNVNATTQTGAFVDQDTVGASFFTQISQAGSSYAPAVKIRSVGAAKTRTYSFGSLHNNDNTISGTIHGINAGDGEPTVWLFNNNGDFVSQGNVTAFSDERLKEDWKDTPSLVEELAQVKSGTYTMKSNGERQVGVSAQSLQTVLPEAVKDSNGTLSVAYGNAALVACVELAKRVLRLEQELQELRNANQA